MARGNCYHTCTSEDDINQISADTLYELDQEGRHDYITLDDDPGEVEKFVSTLTRTGLLVANRIDTEQGRCWEITVKPAETLRQGKCNYFEKRFRKFLDLSRKTTIADFAEGESKTFMELTKTIHDRFGDAIVVDNGLGMTFKTLDSWVRGLQPNETFYLSTTYAFMR